MLASARLAASVDLRLLVLVILKVLALHLLAILGRIPVERLLGRAWVLVLELHDLLVRWGSGNLIALLAEGALKLVDLLGVLDGLTANFRHERLLLGDVLLPLLLCGSLAALGSAGDLGTRLQLRRQALKVVFLRLSFDLLSVGATTNRYGGLNRLSSHGLFVSPCIYVAGILFVLDRVRRRINKALRVLDPRRLRRFDRCDGPNGRSAIGSLVRTLPPNIRLGMVLLLFPVPEVLSLQIADLLSIFAQELIDQQFFSKHDAWLIDDVVELAVVLFENLVVIVFLLVLIVFQVLLAHINRRLVVCSARLLLRVEQLLQNVLDLLLELLV